MKNSKLQAIFCKAAIFTCTCCSYATTIYSDTEWLEVTEKLYCDKCKGACDSNYDAGVIYRDDIDTDIPLHMQMTSMPKGKHHCDNCNQHKSRIHWTEQLVHCHVCKKSSLLFTEYTIGANILQFYEQCIDSAKPAYLQMEWTGKSGFQYFDLNGPGSSFSAT